MALDTHKDAEVRQALEPIVKLADRSSLCVLGLIHVNKSTTSDPLSALMGSRAFAAVARSVLFVMVDPYVVAQLTGEIAVLVALGAKRSSVRRMVVLPSGRVALLGVVVGIVVAFAVPGVLKSLLFGAFDARYVRLHVGRDLVVAMLITYVSEYRASSVDPMQALRGE